MLAILTTHPIQYQVPLWQMLASETSVPFEVWYMSEHATKESRDQEFGTTFAWDLDMLKGYPHRFLKMHAGATPNTPLRMRIAESLPQLFKSNDVKALWVQGWQVAAYWQAVWAAHNAGVEVWLRGESNNLAPTPWWKQIPKRILLGQLFRRVDNFLCIGTANRELYRSYGVPESKLYMTPYAVDNERFALQAKKLEDGRWEIRKQWGISEDAFCVLFCGKFIPKKRPLDLIKAAELLLKSHPELKVNLLFAGSGELGTQMRLACDVVFDADNASSQLPSANSRKPVASFTGFLNQTEVSKAYVTADVLVLPSDYGETWGLVVNEAMASGLPCIISDRCGCASDLDAELGNAVFTCGDVVDLADKLAASAIGKRLPSAPPSLRHTVEIIRDLYPAT
jgi:glycosyltransferase involved in cell wall biosynthesis